MKISFITKHIFVGFILLLVIELITWLFLPHLRTNIYVWILIITILIGLISSTIKKTDKFISGQVGELSIDKELETLGPNFVYFPDVDLDKKKGNIDGVVVGITGVWTIEVKSHKGVITFNGKRLFTNGYAFTKKDFLRQSYAEAKGLQEIIKDKIGMDIQVNPILVFANDDAKVNIPDLTCNGVYVVQKDNLNELITESGSKYLSPEIISKIVKIFRVNNVI